MFTTLAVAARDRKRLAEISGVAARFGLEAVLLRLGLGGGEAHADGPEPLSVSYTHLTLPTIYSV